MLVTAFLETIGVGLIMPFISIIVDPGIIKNNFWFGRIAEFMGMRDYINKPQDFLIFISIAIIVLYIAKNASLGFSNYIQLRFVFTKRSSFGKYLLRSYLSMPYTFHLERNTSELLRNISHEIARLFNFVQALLKIGSELCIFFCIVIMLMWVDLKMVLYSVVILGILSGIFNKLLHSYLKMLGEKVQTSQTYVGQAVLEGLGAIKEVKLAGREDYFCNRYYYYMMENSRANWMFSTINMMPRLFLEVIAVIGVISLLIMFQAKGKDIRLFLPTLSLFGMATIRLMPSLSQIIAGLQQIRFNSPAVDVVYEDMKHLDFHEQKCEPVSTIRNVDQPLFFEKLLWVNNVSYIYPNSDVVALHGATLRIEKGQTVALAGTSGAGKTTLANSILGLIRPTDGTISVDDRSIFDYLAMWQRKIGYVPQSIYLLDATIRENIAFGLSNEDIDDQKIRDAITIARLDLFIDGLADGLNTVIGENGVRLSGGQRQRLGIARALYNGPELLVLDEATSSLDGETEKELTEAIESLSGKKTIIIIAHRLSTIQKCDQIYFMKNGTIIASGTFSELVLINEEFRRMAESGRLEV